VLGNGAWYHACIKRYVVAFAKIFGDVNVFRFEDQDLKKKPLTTFHVPILYQNKNKMYQIRTQSQYSAGVANVFPRMTFRIAGAKYDIERQKVKYNEILGGDDNLARIYTPKPYNFDFKLSIFTRETEDTMMIIEQILSFFTPELTVPIVEIPEIALTSDIKFLLDDNIEFDNPEETELFEDVDQDIEQTDVNFTVFGHIYPPLKDAALISKLILEMGVTNDLDNLDDMEILEEIVLDTTTGEEE